MSNTPDRRAFEDEADDHDDAENWGLLTEEESDKGTAQGTQLKNFSPAGTIKENVDPGCGRFYIGSGR